MEQYLNHYKIRHHEAGADGTLRLGPLFDFLQDTAAEHAAKLGFGMEDLAGKSFLWVLSRIRLQIVRMPAIGEEITVLTYPNGVDKLFARRQFLLCDAQGRELVRAGSFWLVIDAVKLRPLRPELSLGVKLPDNAELPCYFPDIPKLETLSPDAPEVMHYEIGHSQIDVNGHLNNAFYAGFAADATGKLTGRFAASQELQINFQHACLPGDQLSVRAESVSGKIRMEGVIAGNGKVSFQALAIPANG